jgi:hypothetical protein
MYIDSLTITAFIVFAVAMVMFVKKCIIQGCILSPESKAAIKRHIRRGGRQ